MICLSWRLPYLRTGDKVLCEGGREQAGQHLFHPGPELDVEQLSPGARLRHAARPARIHNALRQARQDLIQFIWKDLRIS